MRLLNEGQERGVSLAEALVAVAILGFVGVLVVQGIYYTVMGDNITRVNIMAESLARYELEYVKSVSDNWTNITYTNPTPWSYTLPGGHPKWDNNHSSLPTGYAGYGYAVTVSGTALGGYDSNIQQVTAAVTYNGKSKTQITEYITNSGP